MAQITAKVRCWTSRHLSYAGRAQLVQSVLMSMHIYWCSAFIIPKGVIADVERICRGYLWGSTDERNKPALVAWESVCVPKKYGGLGLKQMGLWNTASLGKQVWALGQREESLWVKWISSVYLKQVDFMNVQEKRGDSWPWKQILRVRDQLAPGFRNGAWLMAADNRYSVASGYYWLLGDLDMFRFAPAVWNRCVLPKKSFILWLVLLRRVITMHRLASWLELDIDSRCVLCGGEQETIPHLFFSCTFSSRFVLALAAWLGITDCPVSHR